MGGAARWKSLASSPVLLPVRLVTGWMFFSAFHRRVVLDAEKLIPGAPGYVGEKFNQFMPGSILGVDHMIAALLDRPAALHAFLWSFTIIEAAVGLALIVGLGTRLAAMGTLMCPPWLRAPSRRSPCWRCSRPTRSSTAGYGAHYATTRCGPASTCSTPT